MLDKKVKIKFKTYMTLQSCEVITKELTNLLTNNIIKIL